MNEEEYKERYPLHWAAQNGNEEEIKRLINGKSGDELKNFVNAQDTKYCATPLHWAARKGNLDAINALIEKGADVNANGATPLHYAAHSGHVDAINALIAAKADVNAKAANGTTPLHCAARSGHVGAIKALIEKGADVNAKNNAGRTALQIVENSNFDEQKKKALTDALKAGKEKQNILIDHLRIQRGSNGQTTETIQARKAYFYHQDVLEVGLNSQEAPAASASFVGSASSNESEGAGAVDGSSSDQAQSISSSDETNPTNNQAKQAATFKIKIKSQDSLEDVLASIKTHLKAIENTSSTQANPAAQENSDQQPTPTATLEQLGNSEFLTNHKSIKYQPDQASQANQIKTHIQNLALALEKNKNLESLDLTGLAIGDDGLKTLATALRKNTALKKLILKNCGISGSGAKYLFYVLRKNSAIEYVDLSNEANSGNSNNSLDEKALAAMQVSLKFGNIVYDLRNVGGVDSETSRELLEAAAKRGEVIFGKESGPLTDQKLSQAKQAKISYLELAKIFRENIEVIGLETAVEARGEGDGVAGGGVSDAAAAKIQKELFLEDLEIYAKLNKKLVFLSRLKPKALVENSELHDFQEKPANSNGASDDDQRHTNGPAARGPVETAPQTPTAKSPIEQIIDLLEKNSPISTAPQESNPEQQKTEFNLVNLDLSGKRFASPASSIEFEKLKQLFEKLKSHYFLNNVDISGNSIAFTQSDDTSSSEDSSSQAKLQIDQLKDLIKQLIKNNPFLTEIKLDGIKIGDAFLDKNFRDQIEKQLNFRKELFEKIIYSNDEIEEPLESPLKKILEQIIFGKTLNADGEDADFVISEKAFDALFVYLEKVATKNHFKDLASVLSFLRTYFEGKAAGVDLEIEEPPLTMQQLADQLKELHPSDPDLKSEDWTQRNKFGITFAELESAMEKWKDEIGVKVKEELKDYQKPESEEESDADREKREKAANKTRRQIFTEIFEKYQKKRNAANSAQHADESSATDPSSTPLDKDHQKLKILELLFKAVYINNGYFPHRTQMLALLFLFNGQGEDKKGNIGQIYTGEGKSVITSMYVIGKYLFGGDETRIDITSSSSDLAKRDFDEQRPLFDLFKIKTALSGTESTFKDDEGVQQFRNPLDQSCKVIYGDFEKLVGYWLRKEFNQKGSKEERFRPGNITETHLFVDEADSQLFDNINTSLLLTHEIPDFKAFDELFHRIFQAAKEKEAEIKAAEIGSEDFKNIIEGPKSGGDSGTEEGVGNSESQKIRELKAIVPFYLHDYFDQNINKWLENACLALKFQKDVDYRIINEAAIEKDQSEKKFEGEIKIMNNATGEMRESMEWSDGLHRFLQIKEGMYLSKQGLPAIFGSYFKYFQSYKTISGITGTLGNQETKEFLKDQYEVGCFEMPHHKKSRLRIAASEQFLEEITVDELKLILDVINAQPKETWVNPTSDEYQKCLEGLIKQKTPNSDGSDGQTSQHEAQPAQMTNPIELNFYLNDLRKLKAAISEYFIRKITDDLIQQKSKENQDLTEVLKLAVETEEIDLVQFLVGPGARAGDDIKSSNKEIEEILKQAKIVSDSKPVLKCSSEVAESIKTFINTKKLLNRISLEVVTKDQKKPEQQAPEQQVPDQQAPDQQVNDHAQKIAKLFSKKVRYKQKDCHLPTLIICPNIAAANALHAKLKGPNDLAKSSAIIHPVIDGKEALKKFLDKHDVADPETGKKGLDFDNVIIATNIAGRGTDIKLTDAVNNAGGLRVIMSYYPDNERIEYQAYGRTGRQGRNGIVHMVAMSDKSADDLIKEARRKEHEIKTSTKERILEALAKDYLMEEYYKIEKAVFKDAESEFKMQHRDYFAMWLNNELPEFIKNDEVKNYLKSEDAKKINEDFKQKLANKLEEFKTNVSDKFLTQPNFFWSHGSKYQEVAGAKEKFDPAILLPERRFRMLPIAKNQFANSKPLATAFYQIAKDGLVSVKPDATTNSEATDGEPQSGSNNNKQQAWSVYDNYYFAWSILKSLHGLQDPKKRESWTIEVKAKKDELRKEAAKHYFLAGKSFGGKTQYLDELAGLKNQSPAQIQTQPACQTQQTAQTLEPYLAAQSEREKALVDQLSDHRFKALAGKKGEELTLKPNSRDLVKQRLLNYGVLKPQRVSKKFQFSESERQSKKTEIDNIFKDNGGEKLGGENLLQKILAISEESLLSNRDNLFSEKDVSGNYTKLNAKVEAIKSKICALRKSEEDFIKKEIEGKDGSDNKIDNHPKNYDLIKEKKAFQDAKQDIKEAQNLLTKNFNDFNNHEIFAELRFKDRLLNQLGIIKIEQLSPLDIDVKKEQYKTELLRRNENYLGSTVSSNTEILVKRKLVELKIYLLKAVIFSKLKSKVKTTNGAARETEQQTKEAADLFFKYSNLIAEFLKDKIEDADSVDLRKFEEDLFTDFVGNKAEDKNYPQQILPARPKKELFSDESNKFNLTAELASAVKSLNNIDQKTDEQTAIAKIGAIKIAENQLQKAGSLLFLHGVLKYPPIEDDLQFSIENTTGTQSADISTKDILDKLLSNLGTVKYQSDIELRETLLVEPRNQANQGNSSSGNDPKIPDKFDPFSQHKKQGIFIHQQVNPYQHLKDPIALPKTPITKQLPVEKLKAATRGRS